MDGERLSFHRPVARADRNLPDPVESEAEFRDVAADGSALIEHAEPPAPPESDDGDGEAAAGYPERCGGHTGVLLEEGLVRAPEDLNDRHHDRSKCVANDQYV